MDIAGFNPTLLLWLNLAGTFVFGLSGGVAAVRAKLDVFGIVVLALVVALAGGIVRDLLIGVPPATFRDWRYLAAAAAAGVWCIFRYPALERRDHVVRRRLQPDHRAGVAPKAGYVVNYYRYFGTTEAPFDWYLAVLSKLASVSTAGVWMRLPATLAGIACWLIISHWVLRRLGPAGAAWRPTAWPCSPRARCSWPPGCRSTTACGLSR